MYDQQCSNISPQLSNWILIEITTFYGLILSAVLFLLFSSLFKLTQTFREDEYATTDFINWSKDSYKYFGLFMTMLVISLVIQNIDMEGKCQTDDMSFTHPMRTLIAIHIIQVASVLYSNHFSIPDGINSYHGICILCAGAIPILIYVYIVIAAIVIDSTSIC